MCVLFYTRSENGVHTGAHDLYITVKCTPYGGGQSNRKLEDRRRTRRQAEEAGRKGTFLRLFYPAILSANARYVPCPDSYCIIQYHVACPAIVSRNAMYPVLLIITRCYVPYPATIHPVHRTVQYDAEWRCRLERRSSLCLSVCIYTEAEVG